MTHVLRIAHLRIALHVANPEVGNREVHRNASAKCRIKFGLAEAELIFSSFT